MRIFLKNTIKIASTWGVEAPPPDLRVVTPTNYYYFDVFNSKCVSLPSKDNKITPVHHTCSAFTCSALLHLFFSSNSAVFMTRGRKNISCPRAQCTLATPLIQFVETIDKIYLIIHNLKFFIEREVDIQLM